MQDTKSLKGHAFTPADLPKSARTGRTAWSAARIAMWCEEQTERYRVLAYTTAGVPVIAEELNERAMREMHPDVRPLVNTLLQHPEAIRVQVARAFDDYGAFDPYEFLTKA
jgi:hypothetical protein